jgi:hypothetical protein
MRWPVTGALELRRVAEDQDGAATSDYFDGGIR